MTDAVTRTTPVVTFEPPAPGQWELETSHHGLRLLTPYLRETYRLRSRPGSSEPMERSGLSLTTVQAEFVHGCLYRRPLVGVPRNSESPPA